MCAGEKNLKRLAFDEAVSKWQFAFYTSGGPPAVPAHRDRNASIVAAASMIRANAGLKNG